MEDALSPQQVSALLDGLDQGVASDPPTPAKSEADGSSRRYSGILNWGSPFVELVANARVVPLLHAALGGDCRLDHEYAHCLQPNATGTPVVRGSIHGGGTGPRRNPADDAGGLGTMISVVYELLDVAPADGGFVRPHFHRWLPLTT